MIHVSEEGRFRYVSLLSLRFSKFGNCFCLLILSYSLQRPKINAPIEVPLSTKAPVRRVDPNETINSFCETYKLSRDAIKLAPSATLELTSRQRGPQPYDLRPHMKPREEMDLSAFLIAPEEKKVMIDESTQSDSWLDRPPSPTYESTRSKSGIDAETQVPHGDRMPRPLDQAGPGCERLFNFDYEVAPLVETLVQHSLDQAQVELINEYELRGLTYRRQKLQGALESDENLEQQIMDRVSKVAAKRKEIVENARKNYMRQLRSLIAVSASLQARTSVSRAILSAMDEIRASGGFPDPVVEDLRANVLPGVYSEVEQRLEMNAISAKLTEALLQASRERKNDLFEAFMAQERLLNKSYSIRVFVRLPRRVEDVEKWAHVPSGWVAPDEDPVEVTESVERDEAGEARHYRTILVGPIRVTGKDVVSKVEALIAEWLEKCNSRHTRYLLEAADEAVLALHVGDRRLDTTVRLMSMDQDDLTRLELRPIRKLRNGKEVPTEWLTDIPEEDPPMEFQSEQLSPVADE